MAVKLKFTCPYGDCNRELTAKSLTDHYKKHYNGNELPNSRSERSRFPNGPQEEIKAAYSKIIDKEVDMKVFNLPKPRKRESKGRKSSRSPHCPRSSNLAPSRKVKKATYGLPQLQIMQPGPI
jgi:hypothetical protein